jgi:hypothetical protein
MEGFLMGKTIDADVLKAAFEMDGYKSPYIERMIDSCPTVGEWISVEDRLPEEGQSVLIHYVDGWTPVGHLLNGRWYQSGGETSWLSVTHWMLLPEPPKEE